MSEPLLRRGLVAGMLGLGLAATPVRAQESLQRTVTVCTSEVFTACAEVTLRAGPTLFELGIRNLGLTVMDEPPSALYNLVLATGGAAVGEPVATLVTPTGTGGAVVSDPAAWEVFDTGDLLFLSALTNRGIGGCATGPDVDGFGQAVTTCGAGSFALFQFPTLSPFSVQDVEVLSLEFAVLSEPVRAASCGVEPCTITADRLDELVEVPEPTSAGLLLVGLLGVGVVARQKRRSRVMRPPTRDRWRQTASAQLLWLPLLVIAGCNEQPVSTEPPNVAPIAGSGSIATVPFGWLPPLGAGTADPSLFHASAAPVVEICEWRDTGCFGSPIARFGTTSTDGEQPLEINSSEGRYEAAWNLMSPALTIRRTYRIRVVAEGAEQGTVFVDVVRGRWAMSRTDGTQAPLTSAASLPIRFQLSRPECVNLVHITLKGAEGTPAAGLHRVPCGASLPYSIRLAAGYEQLFVTTGAGPLPAEGTVTPDGTVFLRASALQTVALSPRGQTIADFATQLYAVSDPVGAYRAAIGEFERLVSDIGFPEALRQMRYAFERARLNADPTQVRAAERALGGQSFTVWSGQATSINEAAVERVSGVAANNVARRTRIVHVNGIRTSPEEAAANAFRLTEALNLRNIRNDLTPPSLISEVELFYNPTLNWERWNELCGSLGDASDAYSGLVSQPVLSGLLSLTPTVFGVARLTEQTIAAATRLCTVGESIDWFNDGSEALEQLIGEWTSRVANLMGWGEGEVRQLPDPDRDATTRAFRESLEDRLRTENILLVPHSQGNLYVQSVLQGATFGDAQLRQIGVVATATPLFYQSFLTSRLGGFRDVMVRGDIIRGFNPTSVPLQTELWNDARQQLYGPYAEAKQEYLQAIREWEASGCFRSPLTTSSPCALPEDVRLRAIPPIDEVLFELLLSKELHHFRDSYLSDASPASLNAIRNGIVEVANALASTGGGGSAPPHDQLVVLPFDGNLRDTEDRSSLSMTTGPVSFESGVATDAVRFLGSAIAYGDAVDALDASSSGTIAFWVRPARLAQQEVVVSYSTDVSNNSLLAVALEDGRVAITWKHPGSSGFTPQVETAEALVPPGVWTHVAITASGSERHRIYINGVERQTRLLDRGTGSNGSAWFATFNEATTLPHRLIVGGLRRAQSLDGESRFSGALDELRVLGRELSASEVADLADAEPPSTQPWCGTSTTFSGNSLPPALVSRQFASGTRPVASGLFNNRVEYRPLDTGFEFGATGAPTPGTSSITATFDGRLASTGSGHYHYLSLTTSTGPTWQMGVVIGSFGNQTPRTALVTYPSGTIGGLGGTLTGGTGIVDEPFAAPFGDYRFEYTFANGSVRWRMWTLPGLSPVLDRWQPASGLDLARVTGFFSTGFLTSGGENLAWMDNFSIQCGQTGSVPPSIAMTTSPGSLTITPGSSAATDVTITRSPGFSGDVSLSVASSLPTGVTTSVVDPGAGNGGSVRFVVSPSASAFTNYEVRIRASGNGVDPVEQSVFITRGTPASITMNVSPASLTIDPGSSRTTSVAITRLQGYSGFVSLTILGGVPTGVTVSLANPGTGNAGTVRFDVAQNGALFTNQRVRIRASGSGIDPVEESVFITRGAADAITLSASPTNLSINPGSSLTSQVAITRSAGFGGAVSLSVPTRLPSGVTTSIVSPGTGNSGSVRFNVAQNGALFSNFAVRIVASSSGVASVEDTVFISRGTTGSIQMSVSPADLLISAGSSGTVGVNITRSAGYAGSVTLSVLSQLPPGVSRVITNPGTGSSGSVRFNVAQNGALFPEHQVRIRASGAGVDPVEQTITIRRQ